MSDSASPNGTNGQINAPLLSTVPSSPSSFTSSSAASGIVEPTYSPEHTRLLSDMRALIASRTKNGFQPTPDFKTQMPMTLHWRDLYHQYRHLTRIPITPDPRLTPGYTPPSLDPTWPDYYLYRFLKARSFSLQSATDMFINATYWRVSFGLDDLAAQKSIPFHDFHLMFMAEELHHTDKEGCPLFLNFLGASNVDELNAYYPPTLPYIIEAALMESGVRAEERSSATHQRRVTLLSVIIQCAGLSLAHRNVIHLITPVLAVDDQIFCENMKQLIIINAPPFFTVLWALVKPLIVKETRAKFAILSPGDTAPLLERIGPEFTPKELGGQCNKCTGPCIPSLHSWDEGWRRIGRGTAAEVEAWEAEAKEEHVKVGARYEHVVTLDVTWGGKGREEVVVWWWCELDAKDIDFSLSFQGGQKGDPSYHLVAPTRHTAKAGPLRGCHHFVVEEAGDAGVATLKWSNSMSTFSGKEMKIKTGVKRIGG